MSSRKEPDMAEKEQEIEEQEIGIEELETISGGDEGAAPPPVSSDGR
jgi:hypothetical protein